MLEPQKPLMDQSQDQNTSQNLNTKRSIEIQESGNKLQDKGGITFSRFEAVEKLKIETSLRDVTYLCCNFCLPNQKWLNLKFTDQSNNEVAKFEVQYYDLKWTSIVDVIKACVCGCCVVCAMGYKAWLPPLQTVNNVHHFRSRHIFKGDIFGTPTEILLQNGIGQMFVSDKVVATSQTHTALSSNLICCAGFCPSQSVASSNLNEKESLERIYTTTDCVGAIKHGCCFNCCYGALNQILSENISVATQQKLPYESLEDSKPFVSTTNQGTRSLKQWTNIYKEMEIDLKNVDTKLKHLHVLNACQIQIQHFSGTTPFCPFDHAHLCGGAKK